jgi:DNA-binding MarR family transcriptional regulator
MNAQRSSISEVIAVDGDSVGLNGLIEMSHLLQRVLEQQMQPFELSAAAQRILFHLYLAPQPLTPTTLAHLLLQETQSVSGLLTRLEQQDLVMRTAHPLDRRSVQIELTDQGAKIARLAVDTLLEMATDLNRELGGTITPCPTAFEHLKRTSITAASMNLSMHEAALDEFWR